VGARLEVALPLLKLFALFNKKYKLPKHVIKQEI